MGIGSFLFGSAPSQDITPTTTLDPEQQKILDLLSGFLGEQLPTAGGELGELSSLEKTSLEGLEQKALELIGGGGTPVTDASTAAVTELAGFDPTAFDEFFRTNVQDPLLADFQETILPGISRKFSADSGFFSTERQGQDRAAGDEIINALTRAKSAGALDAQKLRLGAVEAGRGLDGTGTDILAQILGIGGGVERGAGEAAFGQQNQIVQQLLATLGTPTLENIVFNKPGSAGALTGALGSLAGAAAGPLGAAGGKALVKGIGGLI